ncbi:hypothetical protein niasHT_020614 [Heterodera trifolii]|uniref:Uncharacterized protein n=1 Tax=Heterodera trifolii TaxID=157864 RepID=A0ABD2KKX0_9BILA
MKLILQLIVLFACFWSAKLVSCRFEIVGTVEQSFVDKEAKNSSVECSKQFKYCSKEVCFRDDGHYVTVYACTNSINTDCNNAGGAIYLAQLECNEKNKANEADCEEEKKKDTFVKKYGNYRCEQCEYGKENEENGNANFPLYKPKESGGTVNGISHLLVMIFVAVALFGTAIGHGYVL